MNPQIDETALRVFLSSSVHGPAKILAHKESRPTAVNEPFLSAILFEQNSGKDVLLIAEVKDNHFKALWSSLETLKNLGVVAPRNLDHVVAKEDQYFTFWACNPHDCGGVSGSYVFEVFQVSRKDMKILDVRRCAPADSLKVKMCVTNLNDSDASLSLAARAVVAAQIQSQIIPGTDSASFEF